MTETVARRYRIVISGGYGNGNAGDEALLLVMLDQLREALGGRCEFLIFSDDVSYSRRRSSERFVYSGGRGIFEEGKRGWARLSWFWANLRAIAGCDLFITGGGTILQDSTNPWFVPFWLAKIFLAQVLRKKTMMYGIGVGPMRTRFARMLSRLIVNRMDLVTLRGETSFEVLTGLGIKRPQIYVAADPALALAPAAPERAAEILKCEGVPAAEPFVAFTIRQWYITHAKSLRGRAVWTQQNRERYEALTAGWAEVADRIIAEHDLSVVFIPMSIVGSKDDRQAAADVVAKMKQGDRAYIIRGDYSPRETKALIGQSRLLVAMRLHSAIFGVPLGVPTVAVAYGDKMRDFMREVGRERLVVEVDAVGGGSLLGLVEEALRSPEKATADSEAIATVMRQAGQISVLAAQLLTGADRGRN